MILNDNYEIAEETCKKVNKLIEQDYKKTIKLMSRMRSLTAEAISITQSIEIIDHADSLYKFFKSLPNKNISFTDFRDFILNQTTFFFNKECCHLLTIESDFRKEWIEMDRKLKSDAEHDMNLAENMYIKCGDVLRSNITEHIEYLEQKIKRLTQKKK